MLKEGITGGCLIAVKEGQVTRIIARKEKNQITCLGKRLGSQSKGRVQSGGRLYNLMMKTGLGKRKWRLRLSRTMYWQVHDRKIRGREME